MFYDNKVLIFELFGSNNCCFGFFYIVWYLGCCELKYLLKIFVKLLEGFVLL